MKSMLLSYIENNLIASIVHGLALYHTDEHGVGWEERERGKERL